jgi:hypothetical protein
MDDMLRTYLEENNGFYRIADARALGVSKGTVSGFVKEAGLSKVAHGVYCSEEAWPDRLFLIQIRNRRIIFSHETALYLHGLSDREAAQPVVTVKRGYNASHLKANSIKVYTVIPEWFEIGLQEIQTSSGNTVRVYDRERCICDILREKRRMDIQVFQMALNTYFKDQNKDIHKLMNYASEFGIEKKMRQYTEVLL